MRLYGILGILGGVILFIGDMLLYYNEIEADFILNMAKASNFRLKLSALTALLATWFYMLGLIHINFALKPTKRIIKKIIIGCFAGIFITYGIVHAQYIAIATSAKIALENNLDIGGAVTLAKNINLSLRLFAYPLFALLSVLFIWQVWKRNTLYSRWIILFFPLIPFLFQGILANVLLGKYYTVIIGGFLNIILVVFFLASTINLWSKNVD
jgi:hypothetical protein